MSEHQQRRATPFAGLVVSAIVLAAVLAGAIEWEHYRQLVNWRNLGLRAWDKGFLFWLLFAKTLWLFGPFLAAAALLRRAHRHRTAARLFAGGATALTTWLVGDVLCQQASGNHLVWLLTFVGSHRPLEWAGNATFTQRVSLILLTAILAATGTLCACHWLARRLAGSRPGLVGKRARFVAAGAFAFASLGILLGNSCSHALALQRLEEALPVRLGWYQANPLRFGVAGFQFSFDRRMMEAYRTLQPRIANGQPVDETTRIECGAAPHIIILVLESLRQDALSPQGMPQVNRWAEKALRCQRHYAGSNCSHFGIFSLLYGRTPFVYDVTLKAGIPPQLPRTFRNSGYQCSFVTSGTLDWMGMDSFINKEHFDRVIVEENGTWPDRDRLILRGHIERILREGGQRLQLIVAFLMSTHFDYQYPKEYEKFRPVVDSWSVVDPNLRLIQREVQNRYRNALYFLDAEVGNLLDKLDPKRNLVVVTGDHGESFWDDGTQGHWRKGSDARMLVPLAMTGPGVRPGVIADMTCHADLLPSLLHVLAGRQVPVKRTHGQDIFADKFHNDRLVLFPLGTNNGLLMVTNQQALRVRVRPDKREFQTDGFYDASDNYEPGVVPQSGDEEFWQEILLAELAKLAS